MCMKIHVMLYVNVFDKNVNKLAMVCYIAHGMIRLLVGNHHVSNTMGKKNIKMFWFISCILFSAISLLS